MLSASINSITQIIRLVSNRNFNAPKPLPSQRFSHPKETASIAFVNKDATKVKVSGTAIQMITKARICATVIESVIVGQSFSANDAYNAFAASNPTISPNMEASCLMKPLIKPTTTPAPTITKITISIVAINTVEN